MTNDAANGRTRRSTGRARPDAPATTAARPSVLRPSVSAFVIEISVKEDR